MKEGAANQETNKDVMRLYREKMRRVEAHLATAVKDNKCFYKYINHKTGAKENLLYWMAGET